MRERLRPDRLRSPSPVRSVRNRTISLELSGGTARVSDGCGFRVGGGRGVADGAGWGFSRWCSRPTVGRKTQNTLKNTSFSGRTGPGTPACGTQSPEFNLPPIQCQPTEIRVWMDRPIAPALLQSVTVGCQRCVLSAGSMVSLDPKAKIHAVFTPDNNIVLRVAFTPGTPWRGGEINYPGLCRGVG